MILHKSNIIKSIAVYIFVVLIGWASFISFSLGVNNQRALTESKNTELALHLLAYDYYSKDQPIYNPLTPDGLAEGVAEEVRELSGAEGTLILGSWDAARQAPRSFTYITGKIVVVYDYDEQEESRWKLCYQFKEAAKPER